MGENLSLLPQRAVWWAAQRTLFVADIHLGKAEAFRASGVAAPGACTGHDLDRLAALALKLQAQRLVVLGDLMHARAGITQATGSLLEDFCAGLGGAEVLLVRGNHDIKSGDPPAPQIRCVDAPCILGPFTLMHEPPAQSPGGADNGDAPEGVLCGHLHPAVSLSGRIGRMRAPCYWLTGGVLVLPAFGVFTGGKKIDAREGDRVFAVGPDSVAEVTLSQSTPRRNTRRSQHRCV